MGNVIPAACPCLVSSCSQILVPLYSRISEVKCLSPTNTYSDVVPDPFSDFAVCVFSDCIYWSPTHSQSSTEQCYYKGEIGKLWHLGQILSMACFLDKVLLEHSSTIHLCMFRDASELQQNWIVVIKTVWLTKSKIFTNCLFTNCPLQKKYADSCYKVIEI